MFPKTLRLPFLELFTIALTVWTGFIYVVLFALRGSHHMLHHQNLQILVFGPAAVLLIGLLAYEFLLYRRR